jgi:hypothetical protein
MPSEAQFDEGLKAIDEVVMRVLRKHAPRCDGFVTTWNYEGQCSNKAEIGDRFCASCRKSVDEQNARLGIEAGA